MTEDKELEKVQDLVDPLDGILLSDEKMQDLLTEAVGESLLGLIPCVDKLAGFVGKYQDKLDSAKVAVLLQRLKDGYQKQEDFKNALTALITSNGGLSLFSKSIRIVRHGNYDPEYIGLIAVALRNIAETDFEELFERHDYALSQMERLSPQSLLMLSESDHWTKIKLQGTTTMSGETISGNWSAQIARGVMLSKRIEDTSKELRISHALRELQGAGIVLLGEDKRAGLSAIGVEIFEYLKDALDGVAPTEPHDIRT